jgi:hypothetical protein
MQIRWYGQSAFLISAEARVFVDPFGAMEGVAARGMQFDYPPIEGVEAELLLVTHEHGDHNAVDLVGGSPQVVRSTAGTFDSPSGELIAVASEHDDAAGTKRGPNTIFRNFLDPPDTFLDALGARVERLHDSVLDVEQLLGTNEEPTVALLSAPVGP